MSAVDPFVNVCFNRYQNGYINDAQVVSKLLHTKEAKKALETLLVCIKEQPHWQESGKLKNLYKITKASLKNNFSGKVSAREESQGLGRLSPALWGRISDELPEVKSLFRFSSICKEAYQLRDEVLARSPKQLSRYLSDLLAKLDEPRIMRFLQSCKESSYSDTPLVLRLRSAWPRQAICLHEIQKKFPTIECLHFDKKDITNIEFERLLGACPTVKAIDLSGCNALSARTLADARFPVALEGLCLSGTALDDLALRTLLVNLPKLRRLDITNCAALGLNARLTAQLPSCIEKYEITFERNNESEELLKHLLEAFPDHPVLNVLTCAIKKETVLVDKLKLEKVLKSYPNYFDAHSAYVMTLACLAHTSYCFNADVYEKLLKQALTHSRFCLQLDQTNPELFFVLIFLLVLHEKYEEALSYLPQVIDTVPETKFNSLLGYVYLNLSKGKEAVRYFKLSLDKNRKELLSHFSLALIYTEGLDGVLIDQKEAKRYAACLFEQNLDEDELFLSQRHSLTCAKLCKLLLEDPEMKEKHSAKISALLKLCLKVDPNNAELQSFLLSCTL